VTNQYQTYPLIKSSSSRKIIEYVANVLLIATIVLLLKASEAVAMTSPGAFLMVGAFAASGIRGGLSFQRPAIFQ